MDKTKLKQIFLEFIYAVQENPGYIIGLLDKDGRVISCSLETHIGDKVRIDTSVEEERVYPLKVHSRKFGYLWVHSADATLNMVGSLLFESLKTRVAYEINQEAARHSLSLEDQLIRELLTQKERTYNDIADLVEKLSFNKNMVHVAISIFNSEGFDAEEITGLKYKLNDKSTVYSCVSDQILLIFKGIPDKRMENTFREYIDDFVQELIDWGLTNCYYAIGSLQFNLQLYKTSYANCLWLKHHIQMNKEQPYYFTDYLLTYFTSQHQTENKAAVFDYYKQQAKKIDSAELITIAEQLYKNDFNLKQTAEGLFLHKNTLIYKIKRYEKEFQLDLRGSFQGKVLFYMLGDFFKENLAGKLAGETL